MTPCSSLQAADDLQVPEHDHRRSIRLHHKDAVSAQAIRWALYCFEIALGVGSNFGHLNPQSLVSLQSSATMSFLRSSSTSAGSTASIKHASTSLGEQQGAARRRFPAMNLQLQPCLSCPIFPTICMHTCRYAEDKPEGDEGEAKEGEDAAATAALPAPAAAGGAAPEGGAGEEIVAAEAKKDK